MTKQSRRTFLKSAVAVAAATMIPGAVRAWAGEPVRYRYADTHCHLVDFIQQSDTLKSLLDVMDDNGVDHMQTMGLSVIKKWDRVSPDMPQYYLDDDARAYYYSATDAFVARSWLALPEAAKKRVHPFVCGFNPTDRNAVAHVRRMMEWYPDVWQGIGEIFFRHDDLTALTLGETPVADHPAMDAVYELARDRDFAVQLHSNIGNQHRRESVYLPEVERALRKHPQTRIILAHAGVSRNFNIPTLVEDIARVMDEHPNLWVDLSWVVFENNVAPGGVVDSAWTRLVTDRPERFMVGTDKIGHWNTYDIRKYDIFLDTLPPDTARKVARDNFINHILPRRVRDAL